MSTASTNTNRSPYDLRRRKQQWNTTAARTQTSVLQKQATIWQWRAQVYKDLISAGISGMGENGSQVGPAIGRDDHGAYSADNRGNKPGEIQWHGWEMSFEESFGEESS